MSVDIATLALEMRSDQVRAATLDLRAVPQAAAAAEAANRKLAASSDTAGRSSEEFTRRTRRVIETLSFQAQQITRSAAEQERYNNLRRAGVTAESAAGQAISASTRFVQAQRKAQEELADNTGGLTKAISGLGLIMKANLVIYATEAAFRLAEIGKQAFEAAAGMGELAEKVGLTARELQALQFIGVQNGGTLEDITTAATKFSIKMGQAAEGSKDVVEALKELGVQNLDAQGQLRPTGDLMAEVARKILGIEDPARRASTMVAFFGKSGTTMTASLKSISEGLGAASSEAQKFGAMISDETITRLDQLADAMERGKLRTRAMAAEGLGYLLTQFDKFAESDFAQNMVRGAEAILKTWTETIPEAIGKGLRSAFEEISVVISRFNAELIETFRSLPEQLGKLIIDGMNAVLRRLGASLGAINDAIADNLPWLGAKKGSVPIVQLGGGGASFSDYSNGINAAGQNAEDQILYAQRLERMARDRQAAVSREATMQDAETAARRGARDMPANLLTGLNSAGGSTSAAKDGSAESLAEKIKKETDALKAAADAQDAMTAAARRGDVAFIEQEAHAAALAKAIETYGGKLDATDPKVLALADSLEKLIRRSKEGKAAETFVLGTTELQHQNELLQKQLDLMNEAPEVQAREIALIKVKQEALKAGKALTDADVEARQQAIEQNEKLKIQAEQIKTANELWTEPLKRAWGDIQTAGADAWEKILETGDFTFQSLADTFTKTLRRMAAEFLALATIRPVLTMVVQALGPGGVGVISGNTASQLGVPSGASGGGIGNLFGGSGGGGIGNLFGGSGGGGILSGVNSWLNSPIGGFGGSLMGSSPAATMGAFPGATGLGAPVLGGLTWGQGLGGLASIGMGAYGLLSGGGGLGSTLGGIGQIAGGAMMMIPGLQVPGAILSLVSGLVPGLFDGGPKIPPMPALNYSIGNVINSGAPGVVTDLIRRTGGSGIAGRLYAGSVGGGTTHTWDGSQWQGQQYSQGYLVGPNGSSQMISGTGAGVSQQDAADKLAFQIFRSDVISGAVKGITGTLAKIFGSLTEGTTQAAADAVDFANAYDKLGKAANPVKDAIDALNAKFADLSAKATGYGLSLDPIDAELAKQTKRTAQDFIDAMLDPLAVQQRALADQQEAALASANYIKDNIQGVFVDINGIVDYYGKQRLALEDQFYGGAISNLKALISQLTGGNLANLDPAGAFASLRGSYQTTYQAALGGDTAAIANYSQIASQFAASGLSYYAGSTDYSALRNQILADALNLQGGLGAASGPTGGAPLDTSNPAIGAMTTQFQQLLATVKSLTDQLQQSQSDNARLMGLLTRYVANGSKVTV